MTRKIGIIAKSTITMSILEEQLKHYFEPYCQVIGYSIEQGIYQVAEMDHCFITSEASGIYDVAKNYIPADTTISIPKRLFIPSQIKLLMLIPEGTEVLVINNLSDTCQEAINSLQEANINHLKYLRYYPGCSIDTSKYQYAITFDKPEITPQGSVRLLDLGIRKIHIQELIHLGRKMGIPIERERSYLSEFISEMFNLGKELGRSLVRFEQLNTHLKATFQVVKEPIIAIDNNECVTFINYVAAELFSCEEDHVLGQHYSVIPQSKKIKAFFESPTEMKESLIKIDHQFFVASVETIMHQFEPLGVICILKNVTELQLLEKRVKEQLVRKGHTTSYDFNHIKGESLAITKTISLAKKMANNERNILILGENGTGKELFAHAIHQESTRKKGPFVPINCTAFPENLLESELFGYEEGAFTGAKKGGKPGIFEQADQGTIFLDEIGEISPSIQVKLLRVLQERQVVRIGGAHIIEVNCRIISATNKDLEKAIKTGQFREDLYFRLNVLPIKVPSLQDRIDDLPILVANYLDEIKENRYFSKDVMETFMQYTWPGNIRELKNVIDYAVTVSEQKTITNEDIPETIRKIAGNRKEESIGDISYDELEILKCLYKCFLLNKTIGRSQLLQFPTIRRSDLTEWKLREKLKKLKEEGFIESHTTRKGTIITDKGIKYIRMNK